MVLPLLTGRPLRHHARILPHPACRAAYWGDQGLRRTYTGEELEESEEDVLRLQELCAAKGVPLRHLQSVRAAVRPPLHLDKQLRGEEKYRQI